MCSSDLLKLTCQECLTLRMEVGVGEFARRGRPLASVCNCGKPSEKLVKRINAEYAIDAYRTIEQDPGFGIQQLVDIAVKALSPGVNDTTTAATAVDYLSEVLCELATRRLESAHFFSGSELKIIVRGFTFQKLLHDAFEQIVENAHGNQAVMTHLLKSLKEIGPVVPNGCRRQALVEQLGVIAELAQHTLKSTLARERVEARIAEVRSLLIINAPS